MNRSARFAVWFLALVAITVHATDSDTLHPLDEIRSWAAKFTEENLHSSGNQSTTRATPGALDPRLRLQRCNGELQGVMPAGARSATRPTVGVRCISPAWTVYIPMTIETELQVLVLKSAAARDASLTDADVELQQRIVPGFATGYLTHADQLRGRHLKAAAGPGTPLSIDLLAADILIKRGQRVTLFSAVGGIEVRAQGEAVADATAAGRVRVVNLSSRKVLEGQVESADRVRMSQ